VQRTTSLSHAQAVHNISRKKAREIFRLNGIFRIFRPPSRLRRRRRTLAGDARRKKAEKKTPETRLLRTVRTFRARTAGGTMTGGGVPRPPRHKSRTSAHQDVAATNTKNATYAAPLPLAKPHGGQHQDRFRDSMRSVVPAVSASQNWSPIHGHFRPRGTGSPAPAVARVSPHISYAAGIKDLPMA